MRSLVAGTTGRLGGWQDWIDQGTYGIGGEGVPGGAPNLFAQMFLPKVQNIPGLTPEQQNIQGMQMSRATGDPMTSQEGRAQQIASGFGQLTNPEQQAIDQVNYLTSGPLGSSPATQAAMAAARTPALQDMALAGLGNSDAVGSNLTAAYAPILAQEMQLRGQVIPQLAGIGSRQVQGNMAETDFLKNLGTTLSGRQSGLMGEAFAGQEAGRQIGAQQGEAEYNDFLRMLNAASGVSTGILGQFPLAASSKSTGSQGQIGIK